MTKIRPNIFIGNEYDAHFGPIKENGITVSLNVAHDLNDPIYWQKEICLTVKIGLSDDKHNSSYMIQLAINALSYLVESGHTVLVHCRAGASRSPFVVAHYLAKVEGSEFKNVWDEIGNLRPELLTKSRLGTE